MAPTLQDFNKPVAGNQQLRMDAFQPKARPAPGANSDTVNNIAVYGAALATDDTIDNTYKSIARQLSMSSSSDTLDRILGQWKSNDTQAMTESFREVLVDPNIGEDQKTELMYGWMSGLNETSLSYKVGMSATISPSPGENEEQSNIRALIGEKLQEVDDYNAWAQKTVNALNSESDPNWYAGVKTLTESIMPFIDPTDQIMFENALNAGEGGVANGVQTLLLLGSNRERLRNAFLAMPIAERKPIIENFIKVIRSSKGAIGDTTTLRQIENLERMIIPGAYGNTEKWVDDVFSVMDATVLLSPLRAGLKGAGRLFKGGVAAVEAGDAARVAEATLARSASSLEPLPRSQSLTVIAEPAVPMTNIMSDVDNIIDSLPIEPTGSDIAQLRSSIMKQLDNPNGFSIDDVINEANITDNLTSTQIIDLRQNIGVIRDKRTTYLNASVEVSPASIVEVQARQVASNAQPKSLASTYRNTNPSKARAAHDMIVADQTDQAAKLLAGTTRQDALAHDYLPEIGVNGRVANKVEFDESLAQPIERIIKHVNDSEGTSWMDAAERAATESRIMDDFKNTVGISNRSAMATISHVGDGRSVDEILDAEIPYRNTQSYIDEDVELAELTRRYDEIQDELNAGLKEGDSRAPISREEASKLIDEREALSKRGAEIREDAKKKQNENSLKRSQRREQLSAKSPDQPFIEANDVGVSLKQVYGPKDGGFGDGYIAIDTVRAALAKYGVKDSDITLLARQADGNYAPFTNGDVKNGDFLVQVDYNYRYSPKDAEFGGYDVSPVLKFLRVPDINFMNKEGGVTQQLIPKSLNIDPRAFTPGVAAADRSSGVQKAFLNSAKDFTNKFNKLPKEQQARVDSYIREANEQEIKFSMAGLRTRGMDDNAVEVLSHWKQLQDTLYYFENQDIARGLRDRGFQLYEHRPSDTKLIASRVGRSGAPNRAYDIGTGTFIEMTNKELDELYEAGGQISKLRHKEGEIEYVISKNTPDGGWSRMIRDDDTILNYRDGYYHVKYTDPYYIIRKDADGTQRAIARAETSKDARIEAQRLTSTGDGSEYFFRRDKSLDPFDENIDVAQSTGRSAQKIRGKRLERVKGSNDKTLSDNGMESPLDSLVRSISSVAHRVSYRNVIDAEKRRWMSQWKNLTSKPGMFPDSVGAIRDGEGASEARHAFRHIEQLQSGYGNMVDDVSKAFFSAMSEGAGRLGWGWLDKLAAKAATVDPTKIGRLTAFKLALASNPIRQLPLQAIPGAVIVSSLGPQYWPKITKQLGIMGAWHRGVDLTVTEKVAKYGLNMAETKRFLNDYELSGLSNAVNAHSYLADDLARLADRNVAQRAASIAGKPLRVTQAIGFDTGEQTLMSMVYAMEWNKMNDLVKGRALTATEREQLAAKARALTGDMNRGGDMPYNSNSFSVLMQFLQAPHKMATGLIVGHRGLTTSERLRLGAGYSLAFGLPGIPLMEQFVDKMIPPENIEEREIVKGGLANAMLNGFLSYISGEEVRTDFSDSLQPITFEPMIEFVGELITGNFSELVSGTAAVGLVAEENGRIRKFASAVGNIFTPGSYNNVDEVKQLGITALEMFSGTSNLWKARLISQSGKIRTATGQVVDDDVSYWETMMKAAGFQTIDERNYWEGNMAKWDIDKKIDGDIEKVMDRYFGMLTREGVDVAELESMNKVMKYISEMYADNPALREKAADYYKFKLRQNPDALYKLLGNNGIYSDDQLNTILSRGNLPAEVIEQIKELRTIGVKTNGS